MNTSAVARLQRLRWLLTLLFTVMNAIGLVAFAWLVLREDTSQSEQRMDGELRRVTSTVTRLIQFDGTLRTGLVDGDPLNRQCPQFAVLPGSGKEFEGYLSAKACVTVDPAVLGGLVGQSARSGSLINGYIRGQNGEWLRAGVEPFLADSGQYIGAVVAITDAGPEQSRHDRLVWMVVGGCLLLVLVVAVSGYLLAGRALRPAAAALEQQEVLLAETAHDLRTPVAALRALAETALRNPAERTELLPRTVRLAARMGSIIDGLLVRARLAAGVEQLDRQPIQLDQLVGAVVQETPKAEARVTLTTAPTTVLADPNLVQRAIGNLLDNAIRYGRIPGSEAIVHITVAGGRVTVADHGPGIDAAKAEENFDRFSSSGGSSGLGLSIVRWVAQAHGGTLTVYNAREGGAIFELSLPVVDA
ncbi:two-component sensor histidine kinase [Amycolatopsis antarctica]|uniref:histidine kinase n=1 Tax=Amycolatopsis antarctica TaxID=1854586 RepID=A0A263CYS5_9PSEU|nr:HAMP domain-containing sensor histidine kinase [Amycolatopsis antarctica]OZM71322.1 two-component sensor histidine kinase [Amycolatopsis antarctica]